MPRYKLNTITARRSYTIAEISALLGVDRRTCGRWIRNEGLRVVEENTSPLFVLGADLAGFLKEKRRKAEIQLKENEFYCLKCRGAVRAKIGSEQVIPTGKRIGRDNYEQMKKIGVCEKCETELTRYLGVERRD